MDLPAGGAWSDQSGFTQWLGSVQHARDPLFFAVVDARTDTAVGIASHLRVRPLAGVIEVGWIWCSPRPQRTAAATESMHVMMCRAFADGYRRYEWRCHAVNVASRKAVTRLGFTYEGTFRQDKVVEGRSRDTAWCSSWTASGPGLARDSSRAARHRRYSCWWP